MIDDDHHYWLICRVFWFISLSLSHWDADAPPPVCARHQHDWLMSLSIYIWSFMYYSNLSISYITHIRFSHVPLCWSREGVVKISLFLLHVFTFHYDAVVINWHPGRWPVTPEGGVLLLSIDSVIYGSSSWKLIVAVRVAKFDYAYLVGIFGIIHFIFRIRIPDDPLNATVTNVKPINVGLWKARLVDSMSNKIDVSCQLVSVSSVTKQYLHMFYLLDIIYLSKVKWGKTKVECHLFKLYLLVRCVWTGVCVVKKRMVYVDMERCQRGEEVVRQRFHLVWLILKRDRWWFFSVLKCSQVLTAPRYNGGRTLTDRSPR